MRRWDILADMGPGACLFVGVATGETFAEACLARALRDRAFGEQFDAVRLTLEGRTLHSTSRSAARHGSAEGLPLPGQAAAHMWFC